MAGTHAAARSGRVRRLRGRLSGPASGAVAAQLAQAAGSLLLQLVAARSLGADGLGRFALLFGVIVLTTSLSTGLVGDSLTVLDRQQPPVRAGLQGWTVLVTATAATAVAIVTQVTGILPATGAVVMGAATAAFMVEDLLRRLLMASMRFWSVVVVDLTGGVVALAAVGVAAARGPLTLTSFLVALLLGQLVAGTIAVALLPHRDRWLARGGPRAMAAVWGFGRWRAGQQAVRPSLLALVRLVVVALAGTYALGSLEAARLLSAPLMLAISGIGSYLLAHWAISDGSDLRRDLRRADRLATLLLVTSTVGAVVLVLLAPVLELFVSGGNFPVDATAVLGWALYAASAATVLPYGGLAAVRGRAAAVLGWRVADSALSLGLVVAVLLVGAPASATPYALAVGSFLGGAAIRLGVLPRLLPDRAGGRAR